MKRKISMTVVALMTISNIAFAKTLDFTGLSCQNKKGEEPLLVELYTEGVYGQSLEIPWAKIWDVYLNDELSCFGHEQSADSFLSCGSLFGPLKGVVVRFRNNRNEIEASLIDQFGDSRTLHCDKF